MLVSTDNSKTGGERASVLAAPAEEVISAKSAQLSRSANVTRHFNWPYLVGLIALHLLKLLVFVHWLFSWTGLVSVFVGNYVFGSLGINLAYHRLLTHRGLTVPKW